MHSKTNPRDVGSDLNTVNGGGKLPSPREWPGLDEDTNSHFVGFATGRK